MNKDKQELLLRGEERIALWCKANNFNRPYLNIYMKNRWRFDACGYYRPTSIHIAPDKCANYGFAGRSWSWPGYVVDRTPYGVLAHELGHHVDYTLSQNRGSYFGDFSVNLRKETKEEPITSYTPNDAEWFAEIFRLFVTNADLLQKLRPYTYKYLIDKGLKPVSSDDWRVELSEAPERTLMAASNKINEANKKTTLLL